MKKLFQGVVCGCVADSPETQYLKKFTIYPMFLYRLFIRQSVWALALDGHNFQVDTKRGSFVLRLIEVTLEEEPSWFGLRRVVIDSPQGRYELRGIDQRAATAFCVFFAQEQESARAHDCILRNWAAIKKADDAWVTMESSDRYITNSDLQAWLETVARSRLPACEAIRTVSGLSHDKQQILKRLASVMEDPYGAGALRNKAYAEAECQRFEQFFDRLERSPLTKQQREAIVYDEDNTLVIAGAGCGKTSTIVGKVGYLLEKRLAQPEEILLLAFTHKAAEEMRERIALQFHAPIKVSTFHALGSAILARAYGRKPSICSWAADPKRKSLILMEIVGNLCSDAQYLQKFIAFLISVGKPYRPLWEFSTHEGYRDYLLDNEPRTLRGELTASYEECEIANWLTLHDVRYDYERRYVYDTATQDHRQYRPDFYLPDYKIYIEHWGVNHSGQAAPFMDNDRYQEKMQWAREIHAKHGTCLVETYSWEKMDGVLLSNLERKLTANGVVLGMQSIEKAVADLHAEGEVDPFVALAGSFLSLYKGSGVSMSELHYRVQQLPNSTRYSLFLDLFAPCYEEYEARLRSNDEIDFEDMISRALEVIKSGKDGTHYKYIVIDEFQDIGSGRAALIKELRNKVPGCKLFCVGDDWQSIFRFAGSDISLMTRFDAHFGYTRKALLEKTFRFNSKIAEFSNHFILKNRYQLSKILKTVYASEGPDVLIHWRDNASDPVRLILADLAYSGPAKVFLLTRYAFQVDTSLLRSYRSAFPMLEIEALTVHKSKGLEADYVIIDRLCGGKFGFPSEMVDDAVLDLVLPEADQCSHGEERRLFYVALTRARKRVHLIAEAEMESVFVQEILTDPVYDLGEWVSEKDALRSERPLSSFACPSCRRGHLTLRREVGASFFCCSNSPICDYHMSVCPNCRKGCLLPKGEGVVQCQMCGHEARVCPECGEGVLIERANRRDGSLFNGCSRWRKGGKGCTYTEERVQ